MNTILLSQNTDPWHNLSVEELLFEREAEGVMLYLWQNSNTVVIGRNQNAWKECRVQLLEEEGGRLARRTSGGGAVFHDLGNQNFTFITQRSDYDQERQLSVILAAVNSLGIRAEFSGRNDLLAEGAKFSGNAFRFSKKTGLHHGTLLISSDMDKLARYLAPSREKLKSKGVDSVRSRVVNLASLYPAITPAAMREALICAFRAEYGEYRAITETELDPAALSRTREKHASWEWRLGETPRFDVELTNRFPWGELQLYLSAANGRVSQAAVYSDAMDEAMIRSLPQRLIGCRFQAAELAGALEEAGEAGEAATDVAAWLRTRDL